MPNGKHLFENEFDKRNHKMEIKFSDKKVTLTHSSPINGCPIPFL
ncbi:hypothetical protein LEP1GSC052_4194 [Leptospira kmetyi serovar Malaysia str. Bejo-Iso9]|nr:hypothetical protein LEP1GSC052_4194 [Leptospira kmetyi serovar Malaysia str. Bejo-Iso9]